MVDRYSNVRTSRPIIKNKLIMTEKDDSVYTGETKEMVENGKVTRISHGVGKKTYRDGSSFIGVWNNGVAKGDGVFIHANGEKYEGGFINDMANGFGTYTHLNGQRYEGEWVDDQKHGLGKEFLLNGSHFEG